MAESIRGGLLLLFKEISRWLNPVARHISALTLSVPASKKVAAAARERLVDGWVLIGFWRSWLGETSPKTAIRRDWPPLAALALVLGWNQGWRGWVA
jgi:hypothetical protein